MCSSHEVFSSAWRQHKKENHSYKSNSIKTQLQSKTINKVKKKTVQIWQMSKNKLNLVATFQSCIMPTNKSSDLTRQVYKSMFLSYINWTTASKLSCQDSKSSLAH